MSTEFNDILNEPAIKLICRYLIGNRDYRTVSYLNYLNHPIHSRFQLICQPLLNLAENTPTHILPDRRIWTDKYGRSHRSLDRPAIIWATGRQEWWQHGLKHRDGDQPAIIWPDGSKKWYQNDQLHREVDQPAVIWANGYQEWWKNGKKHGQL